MEFVNFIVQTFFIFISVSVRTSSPTEIGSQSSSTKAGIDSKEIVRDVDGFILVPINTDTREFDFYQTFSREIEPSAKAFFIEYDGVKVVNVDGQDLPFMRLKNITENFKYPCILKIRMGRRTSDSSSEDELYYDEPKEKFLFSISNYQYENVSTGEYKTGSKVEDATDVINTLYDFVNGETGFKLQLVTKIVLQLKSIKSWFKSQTRYNFHGSLLIIVYDAQDLRTNNENLTLSIKMYDFRGITRSNNNQIDLYYVQCLQELIQTFINLDAW